MSVTLGARIGSSGQGGVVLAASADALSYIEGLPLPNECDRFQNEWARPMSVTSDEGVVTSWWLVSDTSYDYLRTSNNIDTGGANRVPASKQPVPAYD